MTTKRRATSVWIPLQAAPGNGTVRDLRRRRAEMETTPLFIGKYSQGKLREVSRTALVRQDRSTENADIAV